MQAADPKDSIDIVLVGGGHSHVGVLRRFGIKPIPGVRLTLVCRDVHTPYSGMLPGYIAGHYTYEEVHIDLARLAEFAGAHFCHDEAVGLDREARHVLCKSHKLIPYDQLSINIGSTPQVKMVPGAAEHAVPVKPIHQFNQRWLALLERVRSHAGVMRIATVGGGAGGVELTLAMQYRLRKELADLGRDPDELEFHLFTADNRILPTHPARVRQAFERKLKSRNVAVHTACPVEAVEAGRVTTSDGQSWQADEIIWVTQAGGAPWLAESGLEVDNGGFVKLRDTLQTITDAKIFAAGDIAHMVNHPREKAGVFAVRQGPPLARNLQRAVQEKTLRPYRPQKKWLALISTGDQYAVASRGSIGFEGNWVWRWKDWIDRRFMHRFTGLPGRS
jgi:selenide, water dikinase